MFILIVARVNILMILLGIGFSSEESALKWIKDNPIHNDEGYYSMFVVVIGD